MKFKKEKDYSLFNSAAAAGVTADQMKSLIAAQQGPDLETVMSDEVHHGDAVKGLIK